jgi:two-component sensor histidine kinase
MKNTLQVVQAIIRRTARAQSTVPRFEAVLLGRVDAMSRAHELLARERWLGAGMATIVGQEIRSFDVGDAIHAGGPNVRLNPKAALSIALAIHELGTNASKYGALSTSKGRISVTWSINRNEGETWLELLWAETGGPEVKPPESSGFGTMLIERSIAYELDGRAAIDYRPKGLECTIAIPLRTTRPAVPELADHKEAETA